MKTIYTYDVEGNSSTIEEDCEHDMFRKFLNMEDSSHITECTIAKMLKDNPQPNVVKIYDVVQDDDTWYIDMEHLDDSYVPLNKYAFDFKKGLEQLHNIGVVYIDIKEDNKGYSVIDGVYKVFDFDCSGIVDIASPKKWIMKPYRNSARYQDLKHVEDYVTSLYELDNMSWELNYKKKYIDT
jgi:serine/threonine protein kinase